MSDHARTVHPGQWSYGRLSMPLRMTHRQRILEETLAEGRRFGVPSAEDETRECRMLSTMPHTGARYRLDVFAVLAFASPSHG